LLTRELEIKLFNFIVIGLALFVGCNSGSETSSEIESVDLTKIVAPNKARVEAEFDIISSGIYKGVFVSNDMSYPGTFMVNLENDSQ
jgi:hypothetical protein